MEDAEIDSYNMQQEGENERKLYTVTIEMKVRRNNYQKRILTFMQNFEGINVRSIE